MLRGHKSLLLVVVLAQGTPASPNAEKSAGVVGRVLTVDGLPVSGVRITALPVPDSLAGKTVLPVVKQVQTGSDGRYRLDSLPAGNYYLAVNGGIRCSPPPFPPIDGRCPIGVGEMVLSTVSLYFPDSRTVSSASVVSVKSAGAEKLPDIRMPFPKVSGRVVSDNPQFLPRREIREGDFLSRQVYGCVLDPAESQNPAHRIRLR